MSGNFDETGSYLGTGAAQLIQTTYRPRKVKVYNKDSKLACWTQEGMEDGGVAVGATGTPTDVALAVGITLNSNGFTVGTGANANESGSTFFYEVTS